MTEAHAARLSVMCDRHDDLVYTGAVISGGRRQTETFPVLVSITVQDGKMPGCISKSAEWCAVMIATVA